MKQALFCRKTVRLPAPLVLAESHVVRLEYASAIIMFQLVSIYMAAAWRVGIGPFLLKKPRLEGRSRGKSRDSYANSTQLAGRCSASAACGGAHPAGHFTGYREHLHKAGSLGTRIIANHVSRCQAVI